MSNTTNMRIQHIPPQELSRRSWCFRSLLVVGPGVLLVVAHRGPMRDVLGRVRWNLVNFWEKTTNVRAAARKAREPYGTAQRWISCWRTACGVELQHKTGQIWALSTAGGETAMELLLEGGLSGGALVGRELHHRGLASRLVHGSTVIRAGSQAAGCHAIQSHVH